MHHEELYLQKSCFYHSLSKYFLSLYYELDTVVGSEDIVVRKVDKVLNFKEHIFWWRMTDNKQANKL